MAILGGGGFLQIGYRHGHVIVNLDRDRTGHLIFTPEQAIHLADLLYLKARQAKEEVEEGQEDEV